MKTLVIVRHAHALPGYEAGVNSDAQRPLSQEGRGKAALTAARLNQLGITPGLIITSPLLRAGQTADILAETLCAPVEKSFELNGLKDEQDVCDFLKEQLEHADCVLAVGHNPNVTYVTHLLAGQVRTFWPGSFAVIDMTVPDRPQLTYFGE